MSCKNSFQRLNSLTFPLEPDGAKVPGYLFCTKYIHAAMMLDNLFDSIDCTINPGSLVQSPITLLFGANVSCINICIHFVFRFYVLDEKEEEVTSRVEYPHSYRVKQALGIVQTLGILHVLCVMFSK